MTNVKRNSKREIPNGFVQEEVPNRKRIANKTTLTLTLSRPTEGTARPVSRSIQSGWMRSQT
jgi:hypothetical protein